MIQQNEQLVARFWQSIASLASTSVVLLKPSIDIVLLCFPFIVLDMLTAWDLSRRVAKKYNIVGRNTGKFMSRKAGKAFDTVIKLILLIITAQIFDKCILTSPVELPQYFAIAFCGWQFWSALENLSSEQDGKLAKILQKVMVNKASRHLDIDLKSILEDKDENSSQEG